MLPILYQSTSSLPSAASMQAIGRLTKVKKCAVKEQLNKSYTLSAAFSPTDELVGEIQVSRFILAKPNPFDPPQFFEIHKCVIDQKGELTVDARHLKQCCCNNAIVSEYAEPQSKTPQGHWNALDLAFDNNFSFSSDITSSAAIETGYTKVDTLGRFLEEMQEVFAGDYHYDNFSVSLLSRRGEAKNYIFRQNSNIDSPKLTLATTNQYTHIVAYAKFTLIGTQNQRSDIQICSEPKRIPVSTAYQKLRRICMIDAADDFLSKEIHAGTNEYYLATVILNNAASAYAQGKALSELQTVESVNLKVKFRPALDEMAAIGLGDTVNVALHGGHTVAGRIVKTEYDSLAERWNSLEIGEERLKLSEIIAKKKR